MDRPVSPDAPMIVTFMLAMQRMSSVVLVNWKGFNFWLETSAGVALSYLLHRGTPEMRGGYDTLPHILRTKS